jgi:CheY-like chemotaxis protein
VARTGTSSGTRSVLIVDDNRDNAATMCELVRAAGCEASVAHDGLTALAHVAREMPEVMLLDIGMPGMDGFELARRVRARPDGQACVLIAMTGWGREDFRHRSVESGFDHFLVKPVDFTKLEPLLVRGRAKDAPSTAS